MTAQQMLVYMFMVCCLMYMIDRNWALAKLGSWLAVAGDDRWDWVQLVIGWNLALQICFGPKALIVLLRRRRAISRQATS